MNAQLAIDTRLRPFEAIRAVRRLFENPMDTRQVFTIFRALRGSSGLRAFRRFAASPSGADLLVRRPSLLAALRDRAALARLPEDSFGRAYLAFMIKGELSADGLVQASEDWENDLVPPDMKFFRDRMRDAHDLMHTLTGYDRGQLGELCLLAFNYAHSRNLGMALIVAMSWPRLTKLARAAVIEGWRQGRKARWFMDQDFEALLPRPLVDVRRELGIAPPARYNALAS